MMDRALRYMAIALVSVAAGNANAGCWEDARLTRLAWEIARDRFPDALSSMPRLELCHDQHFAPGVSGTYFSGPGYVIRIPERTVAQGKLWIVVAHELGHHVNHLRGTDDGSFNGHGAGWMRVMAGAGLVDEAQRVAAHFAGGWSALAEATGVSHSPLAYMPPHVAHGVPPAFHPPAVFVVRARRHGGWR